MPVVVPSETPFSLANFARHANRSDAFASDQAEAELHLQSAIEIVEAECGPMEARNVTETVTPRAGRVFLSTWPVLSVVSATDSTGQAVDVTGATVGVGGEIYSPAWSGTPLTLTVSAGRDPIPSSLILATYIIAVHLWETQRGNDVRPGAFGSEDDGGAVLMGFAIPRRASQLMAPHRQYPVA